MRPGRRVNVSNTLVAPGVKHIAYPLFNRMKVGYSTNPLAADGLWSYEDYALKRFPANIDGYMKRHTVKYIITQYLLRPLGVGANVLDEVLKVTDETR